MLPVYTRISFQVSESTVVTAVEFKEHCSSLSGELVIVFLQQEMADRRSNQKRTREEYEEESPSELALTSLHSENQEDQDSSPIRRIQEDQDSSVPISRIQEDQDSSVPKNVDTLECHVHTFDSQFLNDMVTINFIAPGDHMILVVHSHRKVDLFTR